jgi:N-acetylneuraminic acid mutarotase
MICKKLLLFAIVIFFFACTKNNSASDSNSNDPASLPVISGFSPLAAPVDSIVTITGAHFNLDITKDIVKFNGTVAIVKSATDAQLIVVVPTGASMGKITVTVGSNTATSGANFTVSDQWTLKSGFPGSFMGNVSSFGIGNKLYVGMGEGAGTGNLGVWLQEFWQYDAIADVWTQKADYPGVSTGLGAGFSIGNKGYVVMNPDSTGNSLWQYDTSLNTWTRKTAFPGNSQLGIVAFSVNNYGYVGLGMSNNFWQYDPVADSWTQKGNFPGMASTYAASFVIGNYAYVGSGMNGLNTSSGSAEFFRYDPSSDTWTQKADFPGGGRNSASAFAIADYGYLGTGYNLNGVYLNDFWQYNSSSDSWIQKKNFGGGARSEASGFAGVYQGYLGFGWGQAHMVGQNTYSSTYIDIWQYQP